MDRRTFLKATLVTAGGVITGCSDDESNPVGEDIGLLQDAYDDLDAGISDFSGDMGGDAGMDASLDADAGPVYLDGSAYFPQSVASGDPSADSVILWTRVEDLQSPEQDINLLLEVAVDESFQELISLNGETGLEVLAESQFDHCVKIKLKGLDSATTYYYRFVFESPAGALFASRTGRTKTAPSAETDASVRFAFVSCQDFNGRYYNPYRYLAKQDDLDFVVHLGDYVYETTGDPDFQEQHPDRAMTFTDESSAIPFNEGTDSAYFAAKSLSNYRDLYKVFRSDQDLQAVHERAPFVVIWDDHEFSDDNYGATGTYSDGRDDEHDVARKKAANQAWFEYMPVDYQDDEDFRYDPSVEFPDDLRIFRDLEYGANLHLIMTDLRTYRSDHLVPEDALPGAMAMTESDLLDHLGEVPGSALPYVDIGSYLEGYYQELLGDFADDLDIIADKLVGNVSADWINDMVEALNETALELLPLIEEAEMETLPRGLAYTSVGKTSQFSNLGSRYLVIKENWEILADFEYNRTGGNSEIAMGEGQRDWFTSTVENSSKTWKVWGNEYCLVPRVVDVSNLDFVPDFLRNRFNLSAEDWDGFPNRRDALISLLSDVGNVVAITGDIHAFFAGTPAVRGDNTKKIVEFVTGAISSATYQELLVGQANAVPALRDAGVAALALGVKAFLTDTDSRANPHLGYVDVTHQGFALVSLDSNVLETTFFAVDQALAGEHLGDGSDTLDANFSETRFRVESGSSELYQEINGVWLRWDMEAMAWV
jgi:alkaline phosphatase D